MNKRLWDLEPPAHSCPWLCSLFLGFLASPWVTYTCQRSAALLTTNWQPQTSTAPGPDAVMMRLLWHLACSSCYPSCHGALTLLFPEREFHPHCPRTSSPWSSWAYLFRHEKEKVCAEDRRSRWPPSALWLPFQCHLCHLGHAAHLNSFLPFFEPQHSEGYSVTCSHQLVLLVPGMLTVSLLWAEQFTFINRILSSWQPLSMNIPTLREGNWVSEVIWPTVSQLISGWAISWFWN